MRSQVNNDEDGQAHIEAHLVQATRCVDALEIELEHARRDLIAADSRIDRLAGRQAAMQGEIARLTIAVGEAARDKEATASDLSRLHSIVDAQDATIAAMAHNLRLGEQELEDLRRQAGTPQAGPIVDARPTGAEARTQLAGLQRRLRSAEEDAALQRSLVNLLQAMLQVLSSPGRWWFALLPGFWVQRIKYDRLRKKTLFDTRLYGKRYPDVGRAGADPLHHYISHGLDEGRLRT